MSAPHIDPELAARVIRARRLLDGPWRDPDGSDRAVAAHVADCAECRALGETWHTVEAALAGSDDDIANAPRAQQGQLDAVFELVLARRAAGVRVELPTEVPAPAAPAGRRAAPMPSAGNSRALRRPLVALSAVAAALLAVLAWPLLRMPAPANAGSTAGQLTIRSRSAGAAGSKTLLGSYVPASALATFDSVRLEARTWAGRTGDGTGVVHGWLRRRGNAFSGDVVLPAGAVLAQLVVTSPDGQTIDDNDARRWEWLVTDATGHPTFDALWRQVALYSVDDWERARRAALTMLQRYPESPTSVRFALGYALDLAGPAAADSVRRTFGPAARRAADAVARADTVNGELLGEMVFLAQGLRDTAMVRRWRARLLAESPTSAAAAQQRVFAILDRGSSAPATLAALDTLWREVGSAAPQLAYEAFGLARRGGADSTLRTWGERVLGALPFATASVAEAWRARPALRPAALRLLGDRLAALGATQSDTAWRAALARPTVPAARARQGLLTQFAMTLAADSTPAALQAASDTLKRAAALGAAPQTLDALAEVALARGDTVTARVALAWLSEEPSVPAPRRDVVRARAASFEKDDAFIAERARARASVETRLRATIRARALTLDPSVRDGAGGTTTLRTLVESAERGRPASPLRYALVAFVSRGCAPSLADLPTLERVRTDLGARGVPVIALVEEVPDASVTRILANRGYRGPVAFDDRAQAARALRHVGTPEYVVLDLAAGTALASVRRADDASALLMVLTAHR
ncbi:MAG: TlpA family protein disulfide reductase [Gemmatimonadaceae bacterium]|jgi:hypothetical protein|nr:TlpA family protein disulfide reductase [Gemmatimonadaceae bacterium]